MSKLLELATFRDRIGEIDVGDVNNLLSTALDLVTQPIESLLQTRFTYGEYVDFFSPVVLHPHIVHTPCQIRLSSGFVSVTEAFEIYTASTAKWLLDAPENTDLNYEVDHVMGVVSFIEGVPASHFKVRYTSGLPEVSSDEDWSEDDVPLWLRDIALSYARSVYLRMIWLKAQDDSKKRSPLEIKLNAPSDIELLAQKYIRWFPTYLHPTYSKGV